MGVQTNLATLGSQRNEYLWYYIGIILKQIQGQYTKTIELQRDFI